MVFTMVGLLPQSVRADEAADNEGVSTYALSEHTVQGLSPNGTTINLFDYWVQGRDANDQENGNDYLNRGINANHTLKFGAGMGQSGDPYVANSGNVNQWTISAQPRTGIVKNTLGADGYPVLSDTLGGTSLSYLFNSEAQNGKAVYTNVDGLLQVDNDGYFYYNSQSNFAQFNEGTNSFTLYDEGGVAAGGSSPFGQFFPFNTGSQVFRESNGQLEPNGTKSTDSVINHYFGMTMSTRFVQQYGGYTADESDPNRKQVTYEFSGDDDVWIYIDGVLVGDLGGIHDASSISINFATGSVVINEGKTKTVNLSQWETGAYYDNGWKKNVSIEETTTLKALFDAANVDTSGWNGNTFADNTYHTLNFFYLERGNTDSNMSLKYNLVYIPESDIVKVDQASEPIADVEFELYATKSDYVVGDGAEPTYVGYTDAQGIMRIANQDDYTVSLSEMKNVSDYWVLREKTTPSGYRSIEDVPLYFESKITTHSILLSAEPWDTGAYAQPKLTSTTTQNGIYSVDGDRLDNNGVLSGRMFAVVMQKGDDGKWYPITGDALEGWHVSSTSGLAGAVETAQNGDADRFIRNSNGLYQVDVADMPGDIKTYEWIINNNHTGVEAEYTVQYFYTPADQVSQATVEDTVQVRTTTEQDLVRQFSMQLYVSNIENRFIVRKVDDTGAAVNGATFALYNRSDVTVDQDGNWTTLPSADPIAEVTTATIDLLGGATGQTYELDGTAVIGKSYNGTKLLNGEYYLLETSSPNNAVVNKKAIEIVVDDTGVYANAGTDDDGVLVARGIGRVIGSMQQFTVDDNVDATLHDVKAAIVTSDEYSGDNTNWSEPNWNQTETSGNQSATAMHLQYSDPGDNLPGVVFDYAPIEAGGLTALTTEVGWSKLIIQQCLDHDGSTVSNKTDLETKDISHLFSGTLVIQVTNVPTGDFELSKTVNPTTVTDPFTFDLEFEQQLPADNEETGEAALSTATANYIKTLFPGDYKYTITKSGVTDPVEQGTLSIGEATASGENPGGDTSGEGSPEASAKYIITSVKLNGGADSDYFVASETAGYQVKLAHGETLTINDLPVYTQITATEIEPAGSYLTTVEATPKVTVTEVTASDVEADVDAEGEGNSATDGTETETAVDGENTADGTDDDNTDAATIEELALDGEESAATDGEQMTDAGEDGGADVSNETVTPQTSATSVYTATTIIEKQAAGDGADAPVSYNASIAFTNTQSANATINVQKTLVGTDWATDKGAYKFTITASEETPKAPLPDPAEITIDAESDDSFDKGSETEPVEPSATVRVGSFGEIAFTGVDENNKFVYKISETNPTGEGSGWTYDNHTVTVTVTFHQVEGTNELVADVAYDNSDALTEDDEAEQNAAAFTNTYSATTMYAGLEIVKEMSGRDLADDEFSFSIVPAEGNPLHDDIDALFADSGALSVPVSFGTDHDAEGATISAFEGIEFTQDDDGKEFRFTVSEFIPEENDRELGVTYDQSQYEVKIKVVDNGDGTMHTVTTVTKTVDADGETIAEEPVVYDSSKNPQTPSMTFANSYETQPTPSDGVGDGTFTKSFTGRAWTENDSFTFDLSKVSYQENDQTDPVIEGPDFDNMPMPNPASVTVTSKDLNENSTTDASFGFGEITFSNPGIYTYEVVEKDAGTTSEGISYSDNEATVIFTVTENNPQNGRYSVKCEITYSDETEKGMFANVYTSTGTLDGETDLAVEKTFTGRVDDEWTKDDIFTFVLTGLDGAPMPLDSVDGKKGIAVDAGNVGENGVATSNFGDIAYTQDDAGKTYTYTIEETAGSVQGVFYSKATYKVTVTISDNGNGTLNIEKTVTKTSDDNGDSVDTVASDMTFANTYTPENASYDPQGEHGVAVTKNVKSSDDQLTAAGYTFTMTVVNDATNDSNGVQNATQEKTSDSNGNVTFDNVTFTQAGDYTVTVAETKGNDANMTYDEHKLVYTVKVTDNGQGQLVAEVDQSTVGEGENVFTNVYYDEEDAKHAYDAEGALIDGKLVGVGETLTYKIDWVNTATGEDGSPSVGTVIVVDTLPEGTTVVPDSISEGGLLSVDGRSITWTIAAQAAQAGTVSFQVTVDEAAAGATLQNKATVNGSETNSVTNPVPGKAETTNPDAIGEGTVLTYQVSFANTKGENASAEVVDTLVMGLEYAGRYSVSVNGAEWQGVEFQAEGQSLTWVLSGLPAGAEGVVEFDATVTRDAGLEVENAAIVDGHKTNTTVTPYPTDDKKDVFEADDPTTSVNGKLVGVGDTLTYTIDWAADVDGKVTVTDTVPAGTELVADSISDPGKLSDDGATITWALGQQAAGARGTVSFDVVVTDDAVDHDPVTNTATIQVGENDPKTVTATTDIPKKTVTDSTPDTGYQVGDTMTYTIEWANHEDSEQTVTVTDNLPAGLTYVDGSATPSDGFTTSGQTLTWTFQAAAGAEGTVTFSARVNEQATVVEDPVTNQATIKIGNNEYKTNTTGGDPDEQPKTGELTISKEIVLTDGQGTVIDEDKEFTFVLNLSDASGSQPLTAEYALVDADDEPVLDSEGQPVTVSNGSEITLKHGESVTVVGLPEGANVSVVESVPDGYTSNGQAIEGQEGKAELGGTVSSVEGITLGFKNTYNASPADPASVNFEKQLTGRDWKDTDEFGFTLVPVADESDGVTADDLATALGDSATTASVNSEQKTFSFGEFTFTKVGTYVYQVTEDQPAEGVDTQGVTYSKDIAKVTFTVTDNKAGKLQVETVISGVTISETGAGVFVNSYATKPTSTEGQVDLRGTKTLIGRDSLENEKFEFTLEPTGDTVQAVNEGKLTLPSNPMTESVANLKDGVAVEFEFDDIVVNAAGTYTFAVKETSIPETDQNGMTYDRHIGTLTLTATDDDFDGDFEIAAEFGNVSEGADENDWSFENVYNPTPFVYGDDEVEILGGHKYVEDNAGSFAMADGQFTFTMRAQEAGNPMPDGLEVTTDNEGRSIVSVTNTGTDAANYTSLFDFGTITFDHGDMAGARDNGDGTFTKAFQYNIYENETNMPAGISPQNPGRTYTVTITVTEDVTDGTFEAEASCELITPGAEENQPVDMGKIDFTNVYDAGTTSGSTQIFKTLNGRNWREGDTFTFDVSMTAAGVAEEDLPTFDFSNTGATVDGFTTADGSLSYSITINPSTSGTGNTYAFSTGTATYTHEGVYVSTIAERDVDTGAVPSVSKDKTVYTVTVTVTDVNNVLQRTAVIDPATESGRLDFTNTYTTTGELDPEGDYAITVEKQLVGRDWIADNPETEEVDGDVFRAMLTAQDSVVDGVKLAAADVPMPGGKTGGVDTIELTATSQSGVFDAIAYTRPGTYNYTLTEVQENSIPGVTYSKVVYNVVVTATDKGDGTMTVTSEMTKVADDAGAAIDPVEPVDGATFINTYSVTPTTLSGATYLRVTKVLEGRDWLAGIDSYTFTLALTGGDGSQVTMPEQTLTIDANTPDHAAAFGDITFAAEGTYTFTISEQVPADGKIPGVTYDAVERVVTVDVVDNHDGTLTAKVTSITAVDAAGDTVNSDLTFTNTYDPTDAALEGEGAIKVQKTLTGRAWAEGEAYSFTITNVQAPEGVEAPMPVVDGTVADTITVVAPAEGAVNTAAFGTMTFSQAGTYVYEISENAPAEGDEGYRAMMAYDAHVATVTVAVFEDQAAGVLWTQVSYDNSTAPSADDQYVTGAAAFTNTQNLKCELPLSGTKTLEGRDFQTGDSFTFTVTADDGAPLPVDAEGNVVSEVTINPTAGSVATVDFGTITFTAAGEYVYRIAEQAGKASGMTYDTVEHAVIVTVTDDGQGNLMAAVAPETAANLAWTNSWTFVPGDPFMLTGTKTLTGAQLHNGDFTFLVEPQDNAPMGDSLPAAFNGEPAQNEDGSWTAPVTLLSNITFTAPGDYVYLVSEVNDGRPGYTYDASKYRVTVRVAQDGSISWTVEKNSNGELDDEGNLAWTEAAGNAVAFSNSYAVTEDGTLDGSVNLAGTKTLAGRDWIADAAEGYVNDSFTFVLAAGDEVTQAAIDGNPDEGVDPTVVMPAETAVVLQGGYTDGQQVPFSFGDITFKAAGTYTFTIAEQQPGDEGFVGNTGGMAYDSHVRTVVVSVADNGKGGLTATVAASDGDTNWTNTYTPVFDGATTVNLNGTKVLEGSTLTAGQFFFSVAPLDGAPMGDTWESGNTNGLGASGALENVGDIELLRNVTYTVADMGGQTEKTFRYVVTEEIPSEGNRMPGLAYDGSAYLVGVTVTDDLAGNLVASEPVIEKGVWDGAAFTADEDQSGVEGVVFTNGYTVDGTTAAPVQVTKVLAGNRTEPLAAGEFAFELGIVSAEPADGLTLPEETVVSNAADGTVSFGDASFSKPGTYVLSVTEVVPEGAEQNGDGSYTLDGVTYDTHTVTMTYTVVDQNAQLVATLDAVEGDTTFTNTYNAAGALDGAANLTVTKAVEGDFTWKEGTSFTFALTGADIATQEAIADGTVVLPDNAGGIAIAYNADDPDAPHTASFGDITFKAAGDYLFAITEQQGDIAGMTYDVEQHLVSVAVTDNGDGTLAVVPDADTVNPTITNTYEPTEAVLSGAGNLTVTKSLVGRDWQEGDSFTFMLEADMDDEETASAMNDGAIRLPGNAGGITVAFDANDPEAAHSASFGDIAFTRAGTYRFTVTELAGSIDGVVYDTTAHEVAVTVVDNGDGTLGFAADGVVGANPTITNVFTAPIDYSARSEIVISKTLDGRPAAAGQFSFTVTPADEASALKLGIPEDGYTLSTPAAGDGEKATVNLFATLLGEGKPPVTFTRDDAGTTFSYTVTENGTAPDGYTYDASVYTVDIAVTDDPSAGGLTVTTQVSDGANYTMMTTVTNATEFAQPVEIPFVNSYRASTDAEGGAAAVVNGTKELVGTAMREFSFALEGVAGTNTEGYTNTAVNGEDGSFSFALDYDQDSFTAGATADENGNRSEDFVYTLREVGGGDVTGGITYDDARYRVTVTVTDNGDGTMVASVTELEQRFVDEAGVESWISADAAAFTNTYAAATSVALDVDKVLSGRDMTAADSYEFVAYAYDRATQTIDRTGLVATGSTPAGQTAADGTPAQVAMSPIEYTIEKLNADTATPWVDVTDEAGQPTGARTKTYDYAIEEVVGADLNVSYAPEVFYAQVVVTDDGQGNLSAAKTYFADAAMQQPMVGEDGSPTVPTFVNTYLPDATNFHLTGTKTTTFVNVDSGSEPELRFVYDIYLEENGTSELVASGWSYANGTVSADIPVTGEGSFTYRIVERYAGTTSGTVTYDDAVYYLTLEVARNADTGIYDFAPTYYRVEDDGTWTQIDAAGLTFANTYDGAAGTTVSLGATKVLEGATFEQLGQLNDKFGFSLYEGDDATGTYLGEGTITGVDASGNGIVTFPNLSYTFYLQDQPAAETPDEGEQPEGGETAETPGEGAETGRPDGSAEGTEGEVPEGGQTGEGEGGTTVPSDPNAGQPSGEGGATEPDQPAEPSGDAGAVEPTEPVTPEAPAVEPDQPAVDVPAETPSVDEAPAVEGTPEVAPEAPAEDASGDASVQTASIADLFVASEAIADDADAEPFTVDIVDAGAEVAEVADGAADGAAESAADGQAGTSGETAPAAPAEPVIVSDDLGTHVYTIVENVPAGSTQNEDGTWTAPNGVTYDGTKYRVTVEVAASYDAATQKATMTATVTGIARSDSHGSFEDGHATPVDPTNPAASIVFTNSYTARQPVEVSFAGTKNLTGRDMAEGEFSFAVLEGETPVATATNAADGTVSFSFGVTTPGTHTYTVVEADGGKGGVDYDTAPRTVVVEVGVNPDGTLAVESVALPEGGLVFNNTYTASGSTEAVIEGTKALTGRTMAEGEFRFVVVETVDGIENIVAAGENQAPDEDGVAAITFAPIAYDAEDLGKTFTYQVRELDLGAGGVTYDTAAFTVQVAVVDDLDGTISTEVTYLDGPVAFENSYGTVDGAKVEVTPEATKTLTGRDMADGEFVFTVTDAATGNVVATGANTADGKVVWDAPITLTAKGDYEFAIAEVNGRQDGVTYDDATYRLLVTVADDGEGGLTVESLDYPDGTPAFANSYEEPEKPADPDKPSIPGGPTESVPQTGDDTNLAAAAALGLGGLGAALLGGGALLRRRASR